MTVSGRVTTANLKVPVLVNANVPQLDGPPTQLPAWQVSEEVQLLPSEHEVPFGAMGAVQAPLPESQVPGT